MRRGFYLAGEFRKGKKPGFIFLPQNVKPFEIDRVEGTITGKAIRIFDKNRMNMFPTNWFFFEDYKQTDLNTNNDLREFVNEVWENWCKEHKRKYSPILLEDENDRSN